MSFVRHALKMILMIVGASIVGVILMIGAYALPKQIIRENLFQSIDMLKAEGWRPAWAWDLGLGIGDGGTDWTMLEEACYEGGESTLQQAMLNPYYWHEIDNFSVEELGRGAKGPVYYGRYWHGYLVFLKSMLCLFNVQQIRVLNMIAQFMLTVTVVIAVKDRLGKPYAYAFGVAWVLIAPVSIALCLQYYDIVYITLICSLIIMKKHEWLDQNNRYMYLFLWMGIAIAFFDFLTFPLLALGVALILWHLLHDGKWIRTVFTMLLYSVVWLFGYAGMWLMKMIIGRILTGVDELAVATGEAGYWMSGQFNGWSVTFIDALVQIFKMLVNPPIFAFACVVFAVYVVYMIIVKKKPLISADRIMPLVFVSLYPIVWAIAIPGHTYMHHFFTYRMLAVMAFAWLCILAGTILPEDSQRINQCKKVAQD